MRNYEREQDDRCVGTVCDCCGDEGEPFADFDLAEHLEDKRRTLSLCEDCTTEYQDDLCGTGRDRDRTVLDLAEYEELEKWIADWRKQNPDCPACKNLEVPAMKEAELLLAIQELLDGVAWSPDTLEEIARLMRANGYRIRDIDDHDIDDKDEEVL